MLDSGSRPTSPVLFPVMPPAYIDDAVLHRLAGIFAAVPAFEHRLVRTSWFDEDVLWLAPEDDAPFRRSPRRLSREGLRALERRVRSCHPSTNRSRPGRGQLP